MIAVLTIVLGLAYPLVVLGFGQALFNHKANGSIVKVDGQVVGSSALGQQFTSARYFTARPSAAGITASGSLGDDAKPGDPSDLALSNTGGANLGPTNPALLTDVTDLAVAYRKANGLAPGAKVPIDAVTTSASGVDPEISVANARLQAARVAKSRGLDAKTVDGLIDHYTDGRSLGFLGDPGVNVLELNLALDRLSHS
jgi:K+-transporting ATPase ATPase C chain